MNEKPEKNPATHQTPKGTAEEFNHIQKVIAVMSGKGGVGKSFVTGLLASSLARSGLRIGVLDADITGPSIPMLFGLHGRVEAGEHGILPDISANGIKVISMNLLLKSEDQPVIWRGPLVSRAIQQLWGDVMWGDLDLLLIDLPPGTSDATLTIMQSLPVDGLVMVTTPQSLASMVVRKTVHMAQIVDVPILGIVENMAYFNAPETDQPIYIFGKSHTSAVAEAADAPVLAQIPIDPLISDLCDAGQIEQIQFSGLDQLLDAFSRAADLALPDSNVVRVKHVESVSLSGAKQPKINIDSEDLTMYSAVARAIIQNKENLGHFDQSDLSGKIKGCCGDSIQIELLLDGNIIKDACYSTDGCSATMACGGMITRLIQGKSLAEAEKLNRDQLIQALGGLPQGHAHCADLAVNTLRKVIHQGASERTAKLSARG